MRTVRCSRPARRSRVRAWNQTCHSVTESGTSKEKLTEPSSPSSKWGSKKAVSAKSLRSSMSPVAVSSPVSGGRPSPSSWALPASSWAKFPPSVATADSATGAASATSRLSSIIAWGAAGIPGLARILSIRPPRPGPPMP